MQPLPDGQGPLSCPSTTGWIDRPNSEKMQGTMNAHTTLWIYIVLLLAGGIAGFLKGKSRISLVTSVGAAIPLILCNLGTIRFGVASWILIALLLVFAWRLAKTRKFMPAGLLLLLSAAALALLHLMP
jgi:uncharacterized membrane protein (UPF0136 family)